MNECNDPDHGAINAERSESRGLRKAWIELDDKRQILERELAATRAEIDEIHATGGCSYIELHKVIELRKVLKAWDDATWLEGSDFESFRETLQSLTPNEL